MLAQCVPSLRESIYKYLTPLMKLHFHGILDHCLLKAVDPTFNILKYSAVGNFCYHRQMITETPNRAIHTRAQLFSFSRRK